MSGGLQSPSTNSLHFGVAGLSVQSPAALSADAKYGEGSGPNKRPHTEEEQGVPQPQQGFQPQAAGDRQKRKGQKRVGKKLEPQPLVGMFNDGTTF